MEIIAIIISGIGIIISVASVYYCRKQTKLMEKRKFTDDPINPYTVKLDSIANAIYDVSKKLGDKKTRSEN